MLGPRDAARRNGDRMQIQDLLDTSCHLADAAGFTVFPGCEVTPYATLLESIPVRARSLFPTDVKRLAFDIGSKISAIEAI